MSQIKELLIEELEDLRSAEQQILKALPKAIGACSNPKLKEVFEKHLSQTQGQVSRLDECFTALGHKPSGKVCKAMKGLIEEAEEKLSELDAKEEFAGDLCIAAMAQKIEHYEISGYGTARVLARQVGELEVEKLLCRTLGEEEAADYLLTEASKPILQQASAEEWEGEDLDADEETIPIARSARSKRGEASESRR